MLGLSLTVYITRFISSLFVSIIIGIVASSLLAAVATHNGYNGDVVFNVAGVVALFLAFWGCWQMKGESISRPAPRSRRLGSPYRSP